VNDIRHAQYGVEMAEEMGLDPKIVEIIRRHVGGGLTHDEAERLGLPSWDGMPRTMEEKIVCHADTLVGAHGRRTLKQTLKHIRKKGDQLYVLRVKELHAYLSGLAERDIDSFGPWTLPRAGRKRKYDIDMPPLPETPDSDNIKYP
jgi:HD superfamily phosphodiesterase